ncbi:MAG: PBP1A family penicillin-binding protein [Candidatus Latescibacteria bacterium]|nr:PBP1A family penicillin-binding protein [Candidatus Latescibacterota bacterium]
MQQNKTRKRKNKSSRKNVILYTFLGYFLFFEFLIILAAYFSIRELSIGLPGIKELEKVPIEQDLSTIVYSADGVELRTFQREKRFWVAYKDIPKSMIDAILSAEDSRFFSHWGVSPPDILRAMKVNILNMGIEEGASTITQQLARDLFLDRKQTIRRKLKEMIVAIKIEHTYSKSEILEFFLNRMEFSNNWFGIQAAARGYFGKNASQLNIPEAALLAGLLQAPSKYNPRSTRNPPQEQLKIAQNRRDTVINMMVRAERLPYWRASEEKAKPIELSTLTESDYGKAPYFVDNVRRILEDDPQFGKEFVETSGARVYTTLDYRLQLIAEKALRNQLDIIQKAYADKIEYIRPPGLTDAEAVRDSLDKTVVQGALVAMDVKTGQVLAMTGGKEFSTRNQFNRATQAIRSAGSSFKPFVYTAALDNGWRCCDTIYDGYVSYDNPDGTVWEPRNFTKEYLGVLSLRDGFKKSQNVIAIKLVNDMKNRGIGPPMVVKYAKQMGITTPIPAVRSIAIGTSEVKLIELVSAYTTFPNRGIKTENISIKKILDKNNTVIFQQDSGTRNDCLRPEVSSLMVTMLRSIVTEGTGSIIIPLYGMGNRICAGKTGTGQEYKDAWFIGFTPYIACGVWVGFDSEETTLMPPQHTGATAALPVWTVFMKEASELLEYPNEDFVLSNRLTTVPICKDSYLRAGPNCPQERIYTEYFIPGTEVSEFCDLHVNERRFPNNNRLVPGNRKSIRNQ